MRKGNVENRFLTRCRIKWKTISRGRRANERSEKAGENRREKNRGGGFVTLMFWRRKGLRYFKKNPEESKKEHTSQEKNKSGRDRRGVIPTNHSLWKQKRTVLDTLEERPFRSSPSEKGDGQKKKGRVGERGESAPGSGLLR